MLAATTIKSHWNGKWIWCQNPGRQENTFAFFRRRFETGEDCRLDIDITADTFYMLYVDGRFLHRGPARAHLSQYSFDRFSVQIGAGRHVIAVLVHHVGQVCACYELGKPGLLVDARVPGQDLSSGPSWKAWDTRAYAPRPAMLCHFGWQEDIDYREYPTGFEKLDFDDSDRPFAVQVEEVVWKNLSLRDIPTFDYIRKAPVNVSTGNFTEGEQGDFHITASHRVRRPLQTNAALPLSMKRNQYCIVDFGKTVSGTVEITLSGAVVGSQAILSYDDQLSGGVVDPARTYALYADRFVIGKSVQVLTTATPRGFRYIMLDLEEGCTIEKIEAVAEEYHYQSMQAFECGDERLNTLYRQCLETTKTCTIDGFADCLTRERVLWMQDLFIDSLNTAYSYPDFALTRRMLLMFAQGQQENGRIITYTPSDLTWCSNPPGNFLWIQLITEYYKHTGDAQTVRQLVPVVERLLGYFRSCENEEGLICRWDGDEQFWDWGFYEQEGILLMTNAYYSHILTLLSEMPLFDGIAGQAAADKAAALKALCFERFYDREKGLFIDAILPDGTRSPLVTQEANAIAILSGVCPAELAPALLDRITDPAALGRISVGEERLTPELREAYTGIVPVGTMVGAANLCIAAFSIGAAQKGLDLIGEIWFRFLDEPTLPEMIVNGWNNTVCHGWSASPAYLLPMYELGLRPTADGWAKVQFAPPAAGLPYANGSVSTVKGRVSVGYCRHDGMMKLYVCIPDGVEMTVRYGAFEQTVREAGVSEFYIAEEVK